MAREILAEVSGVTERFAGTGRKLGYPTANVKAATDLSDGVYFGYADLGEYINHPALIFIGKPKVIADKKWRVEAHLLDIEDLDYYGQDLKLKIMYFHRPNKFFDSKEKLIEAIRNDEAAGRELFEEWGVN